MSIYPRLSTVIDKYISEVLPTKSHAHEEMQTGQLRYWKSKLGSYRINQITSELVSSNLPNRSNATKNRYLSAISSVLNHNGQDIRFKRFREPRGIVRFLSDNERIGLLEACRKSLNPHLYPIVVLALSSGMRKMEILKLEWSRVDLDRGLIHLVETKNDQPRTIPLLGYALNLISQLPRTSSYVFPSRSGSYYRDIDHPWKKALREAEITGYRFHDNRHSCGSYLAQAGVPLYTIGEILGHKSLEMTRRYAHLSVDHLRGALGDLNDMMFREE